MTKVSTIRRINISGTVRLGEPAKFQVGLPKQTTILSVMIQDGLIYLVVKSNTDIELEEREFVSYPSETSIIEEDGESLNYIGTVVRDTCPYGKGYHLHIFERLKQAPYITI